MLYVDEERQPHPEELHDLGRGTLLPDEVHGGHRSKRHRENLIHRNFMISDGEHFYPMKFMVDTGANITVISKLS